MVLETNCQLLAAVSMTVVQIACSPFSMRTVAVMDVFQSVTGVQIMSPNSIKRIYSPRCCYFYFFFKDIALKEHAVTDGRRGCLKNGFFTCCVSRRLHANRFQLDLKNPSMFLWSINGPTVTPPVHCRQTAAAAPYSLTAVWINPDKTAVPPKYSSTSPRKHLD